MAISAGEHPALLRVNILVSIRLILLVSIAFLVAGKLAMLRTAYRYHNAVGIDT